MVRAGLRVRLGLLCWVALAELRLLARALGRGFLVRCLRFILAINSSAEKHREFRTFAPLELARLVDPGSPRP
jgi:hypothetical protein